MSRDQWNWTKVTGTTYTNSARGFTATVTINVGGTATLTVVGAGAPGAATYDTRRQALSAFVKFLRTKPVT